MFIFPKKAKLVTQFGTYRVEDISYDKNILHVTVIGEYFADDKWSLGSPPYSLFVSGDFELRPIRPEFEIEKERELVLEDFF